MSRRNATRTDVCQLPLLFDLPEPEQTQEAKPEPVQDQEMITVPFGRDQVQLPLVIFKEIAGWANGDTSPRALERLAETELLDITTIYYGPPESTMVEKDRWKLEYGHSIAGYERYWYRCVSSGIVDGQVWGCYQYEKCCGDLTRWHNPYEDDDIE
jgi:hypothetical protein